MVFTNLAGLKVVVWWRFLQEDAEQGNKFCWGALFLRFLITWFMHLTMMTAALGSTKAVTLAISGNFPRLGQPVRAPYGWRMTPTTDLRAQTLEFGTLKNRDREGLID
jgi:hypothetical protein